MRHTSVRIRLCDKPSRAVGHSEIEDFTLFHQIVEAVHDLLDAAGVVPPVKVEDVDVIGAKLPERGVDGVVKGFRVVSSEVRFLWDLFGGGSACVICRVLSYIELGSCIM